MLKRLWLLAGLLSLVTTSAFAAGTVPGFNLTPQFDLSGKLAPGCKVYIIQAGTTSTPQNAYQDTGLTQVLPNPLTCDAAGRPPQWFVADGTIKIRLTTSAGTQIFVGDNLLVVGPSSGGGGGGGTVDPTTIIQTGQLMNMYGTGVLTGFVRANGRTIGSAASGATERANADTSALFSYLWGADGSLVVSGGRGASAAADFAANKTIATPDMRGRVLAGFDDMGASAAGRLTTATMTGNGIGAVGGGENVTMALGNLIQHTHANTLSDPGHTHTERAQSNSSGSDFVVAGTTGAFSVGTATPQTTLSSTTGITITNAAAGSASPTPMRTVQPTMFVTIYIKL